jgi:pimeloyl-ACP methyl ester carboxylesterase
VTLPAQAARAPAKFPDARLHRFADCGHFPQWGKPEETVRLVLETIGD